MKCCKKCNEFKSYDEFGKNKSKKDGIDIYCKKCNALKTLNSKKDKEEIRIYNKEYRVKNSSKLKDYHLNYYLNNSDIIKDRTKSYSKTEKSKKYKKKYRLENKEKISEYNVTYRDIKKDDQIRHRISESLKSFGSKKNNKTVDIVGCSIEDLKLYLESKFESCMTCENYCKYNGEFNYGWNIDHIIPLSSAKTEEELIRLNHYTNLQPLCSYVNRYIKKDNIYEIY
jgi:hypothetical protein